MKDPPVIPGFGIVALGGALGEPVSIPEVVASYTDRVDRVLSWGYERFHRAPDGVGLTDLAFAAASEALERAGIGAAELDLVVLATSDIAEYLYWDAAAAVQARLGADRAEAVLLNQACGGGVAAFDTVAGKFATHTAYTKAVLIGANRVCDAYWNRMTMNTAVYSDGAAAAVVTRDAPGRRWLTTELVTDGRYADFLRMEAGGSAQPFGAGNDAADLRVRGPGDRLEEFFAGDITRMLEFVALIRERNTAVVESACKRAGLSLGDLTRLIHLHDNVKQFAELAHGLGLSLEQTNVRLAASFGHVGCADQLLSLRSHLDAGDLSSGDIVALTSTGSGMHWACTLLEV